MYKKNVGLRAMAAAAAIGTLSIFAMPQNAAAQGPAGSYRNSCRSVTMTRGGYLQAECKKVNGTWQQTRLRVADCRGGDIANNNGRLTCTGSRRNEDNRGGWNGRGDHNDRGRHDDRGKHNGKGKHDYDRDRRDRDDWDRRGSNTASGIILYGATDFNGRSMTIRNNMTNLGATGMNDDASSVRVLGRGTWRLCSEKNFGGRCVNVSSDVRDLKRIGMQNKVSSVQRVR